MFVAFLSRVCVLFFCALFVPLSVAVEPSPEIIPPDVLIKMLTEEVIVAIKKEKHGQQGHRVMVTALVEEKVAPHFNFEQMTMLAMGREWRHATSEERSQLIHEFHTLLVRTYGTLLDGYHDQAIVFLPFRAAPDDTDVTVRAHVRRSGGETITIAIRMQKWPEGWKAYDIIIDGASLVIAYQSTFKEEIARTGISGLIQMLIEKNK